MTFLDHIVRWRSLPATHLAEVIMNLLGFQLHQVEKITCQKCIPPVFNSWLKILLLSSYDPFYRLVQSVLKFLRNFFFIVSYAKLCLEVVVIFDLVNNNPLIIQVCSFREQLLFHFFFHSELYLTMFCSYRMLNFIFRIKNVEQVTILPSWFSFVPVVSANNFYTIV